MSSIIKLSDKCEKCMYKNDCNNKRMMACAVTNSACNPMLNKATPITINMGEYGNINITMENIKEQLNKSLRINACSFNK